MVWWVTHPPNWLESQSEGADASRRPGSTDRYSLVSAGMTPRAVSRPGTYAIAAIVATPSAHQRRMAIGGGDTTAQGMAPNTP